jgi:hypothetical protein
MEGLEQSLKIQIANPDQNKIEIFIPMQKDKVFSRANRWFSAQFQTQKFTSPSRERWNLKADQVGNRAECKRVNR